MLSINCAAGPPSDASFCSSFLWRTVRDSSDAVCHSSTARRLASLGSETTSGSSRHRALSVGRVDATDSTRSLRRPISWAPSGPRLLQSVCVASAPVYLRLFTGPPKDCDPDM